MDSFINQVRAHLHGNIRPAAECKSPRRPLPRIDPFCTHDRHAIVAGRRLVIRDKVFVMLTSQKVIDAINEQIGYEFSASLQYYAIAAHFAAEALPQLSQHFFRQAEEEKGHALRFIKYVVDAGGRVLIPAIDAPKSKFKVPRDAVKLSLDQEIHVTNQINGLVGLARKANDYITINFLQWFLTEQLEEVSSMDHLLKIVERAGDDLLQADEYLARVGIRAIPEPAK
jgi:ferritin